MTKKWPEDAIQLRSISHAFLKLNKIKRSCDLGVWSGAFSLIHLVYGVYDLQSLQG